jgi:hypothetical protein
MNLLGYIVQMHLFEPFSVLTPLFMISHILFSIKVDMKGGYFIVALLPFKPPVL